MEQTALLELAASRPRAASARIPTLSADTFDGESARLAETGMDDYVGKPVEPDNLVEVVTRWLPTSRRVDARGAS